MKENKVPIPLTKEEMQYLLASIHNLDVTIQLMNLDEEDTTSSRERWYGAILAANTILISVLGSVEISTEGSAQDALILAKEILSKNGKIHILSDKEKKH